MLNCTRSEYLLAAATIRTTRRPVATLLAALLALGLLSATGCNDGSSGSSSTVTATDDPADPADPDSSQSPVATVEGTVPAPFAANATLDQQITVFFTEPMDAATVTSGVAHLVSDTTGRVAATLNQLSADGLSLELNSVRRFLAGEIVHVALSKSLRTLAGGRFGGDTFRFRTATLPPPSSRTRQQVFTALGRMEQVLTADLNQDGNIDVVYSIENGSTIDLLNGQGDGTFVSAMRIDALQTVLALTLADADGDGDVDIYVGTADRTRLYVNRLVEEGGAQVDLSFALGPEAPTASAVREITVADVDFEEPPDVVMATDAGIQIRLQGLEGAAAQTLGSGPETRSNLVLADLDLDGRLDLVYGNRRGGQVTVHFGVADASTPFSQAEHIDLDTDATQVAVDDFVGDSLPEIVVLTVDGASNPSALRLVTQENGAFVVNSSFGPAAPAGGAGATVALDSGRFAVGDLNGDGRLDLILAAEVLGQALVFENNGSLTPFQGAPRELMTLPSPQQMALADLTGSGALDVLAASGNELHAILPTEVEPPPPPAGTFQLSIDPVEARQGDLDAAALVRLTNSDPLGGYTVVLVHDPDTITPTAAGIEGTITGAAAVEFMNFSADTDRHTSSFSVLVDILPPIENRQLPVGQNQLLFRLLFDVPQDAPLGPSTLSFDDGTINPAVRTVVVVGANSVQPQTSPGTVSILPAQTEPPPGNPNVMRVTNAAIGVGQEGAVSILGTVEQEADAFTIIGAVDPDNLEILELDLTGSVTETLGPEFVQPSIRPDEGNFVFTTILDFLPPFLRQTLPPGQDQLLLTVRLRAHDDADPGTYPLPLVNGVGEPPLNNIFVFDGQSVFPALLPGEVRVGSEPPPTAATFIRGDANADDRINLADANFISNFLSLSGPTPPCLDAADANDDGEVTTDDATYILNFAAVGGAPPPPPFPEAGPDPTADGLSCGDSP